MTQTRSPPKARESLLSNPFFWGAVIGVIFITAIRPFMRRVPEPPDVIGHVPDWSLVNQDGDAFGSTDLEGQVYVVTFFFSHCTTICPKLMAAATELARRYDEWDLPVRMVSITVDPENDTPEVLRAFAKRVGADPKRWTFVTGDEAALHKLVTEGFLTHRGQKTASEDGVVDIAHGARFILVDREGGVRGHYESSELGLSEVFHRSKRLVIATQ